MTVGFFMPLPLAVMIPFMAGQSFAMGEAFGKGFQYGKRKVSSMTNEEFNASSAPQMFGETTADISAMIPAMKDQMNNFSMLQTDIIKTLIDQLKNAGIQITERIESEISDLTIVSDPDQAGTNALANLRTIVGLPPIYSKLVEPSGVNALLKFWQDSNLMNALKLALNPSTWIFNQLKGIFNQSPPQNTVLDVLSFMQQNQFIGPPAPETITEPPPTQQENTIVVLEDGTIINNDTRVDTTRGQSGELRAPSSIITQFNKLNSQIPALTEAILQATGSGSYNGQTKSVWVGQRKDVHFAMITLWEKYDLVGKVNSNNYKSGWVNNITLH